MGSLALASKPAGHLFVDTHLVCETLQVRPHDGLKLGRPASARQILTK